MPKWSRKLEKPPAGHIRRERWVMTPEIRAQLNSPSAPVVPSVVGPSTRADPVTEVDGDESRSGRGS